MLFQKSVRSASDPLRGGRDAGDPGSNDQRLQQQAGIKLGAAQFRPAPLPGNEANERQARHQPSRGALGHETDGSPEVHESVAAQFWPSRRRVIAAPYPEQRERVAGHETGIGRQPDSHAQAQQRTAGHERGEHRRQQFQVHGERQRTHSEDGDQDVDQVGRAGGSGGVTQQRQRRRRHPVGQRRLLQEGHTGQLWQRALALQAHAPGNIRLARFIRCPQAATEDSDQPQRGERDDH